MALHSTGMKVGLTLMLILSIAGGAVVIGGLGAATNQCREHAHKVLKGQETDQDIITGISIVATNHLQPFPRMGEWQAGRIADDESAAYDCGIFLSLDWWLVAYEVFTFVYGLCAVFSEFFHSKHSVMCIFTIKIVLATLITSVYVKIAYNFEGGSHSDVEMGQYTKTGAAGGIIILVANYIFLFMFGSEEVAAEPAADAEAKA